jgi:hypothetical protein
LAALFLGLQSLGDCAAAWAACHETATGMIRLASSEYADMSADRNERGLSVAPTDSIVDLAEIKRGSALPDLPQKMVHESESLPQ